MWTQNKLFQPQNPTPEGQPMTTPYPLLDDDMKVFEIIKILSDLVFTKSREYRRAIYITPKSRDKIVKALLSTTHKWGDL